MRRFIVIGLLLAGAVWADDSTLSLDRIFESDEFRIDEPPAPRWLQDGSGFLSSEDEGVVFYELETGRRELIVPRERLNLPGGGAPGPFERAAWTHDRRKFLFPGNGQGSWLLDFTAEGLRRIGKGLGAISGAQFSPDGSRVAYVYDRDLYVEDLSTAEIVQLTRDGSETIVNALAEGVYRGLNASGFCWSPDGRRIAFVQFDIAGVEQFTIINYTDSLYPKLESFPHVKPGRTLSAARAMVVAAQGGEAIEINVPGDPRNRYLTRLDWVDATGELTLQTINRLQNTVEVATADPASGERRVVWRESDEAWLEPVSAQWLANGRQFVWVSEREGRRSIYLHSRDGEAPKRLTPEAVDILALDSLDEDGGWVYYSASPANPTQRYLYRVPLDGSADAERVTPENLAGTHRYQIAPGGRWAQHVYSTISAPPLSELVELAGHRVVQTLADNSSVRRLLAKLPENPPEFFRIDIGDDVELDGWMIKPIDFDPAKRYSVLFHVYGMPAAQTVLDQWGGNRYLWHQMLAQRGYFVMSVDNRGTPAPKGRAWRKIIYKRHGVLPAQDQASALRALLAERPYLDPERIGVYGWSGGGLVSTQLILRYPELYSTAMPGAGISHHRFYHAAFTERYLGPPQGNPEVYEATASLNLAQNLKGNLLLIHGTGDSNVHYQSSEALINALIAAKKRFTMMAYPNRNHGMREGEHTQYHLYDLYTWYLETHMPPGPSD